MNEAVRRTGVFVMRLLNHPTDQVLLGRRNFEREDFSIPYIVVDQLGAGVTLHQADHFDWEAEALTTAIAMRFPITINFYGGGDGDTEGAFGRAMRFVAQYRREAWARLADEQEIAVMAPQNPTDVKSLTGQQYGERYEVQVQVHWTAEHTESVRRLDSAQIDQTLYE